MNRQQAKDLLPIIQAFAEGKEIEFRNKSFKEWSMIENPSFDPNITSYRIKPEPNYRPFKDAEECWQEMLKHQPFGWLKSKTDKNYSFILNVDEDSCHFAGDESWSFADLLETETFADGTPFGIKE